MNANDLIGSVGAALLRKRLLSTSGDDGVARLMLDKLKGGEVAAIVRALLTDRDVAELVSVRIPRALVAGYEVPEHVLTDQRTVALRNSSWDTPALLIANTEDDQGTSLQDVFKIGAKILTGEPKLWVEAAAAGLDLHDNPRQIWNAALAGLVATQDLSLHQIATYVALTRRRIAEESKPIDEALGWALPALALPRDSAHFQSMRPNDQLARGKWKKLFEKLIGERAPLLVKQRKNGQTIESDELRAQWNTVKDDVQASSHAAIEAFIGTSPKWTKEVEQLADLEWEADGVNQLFLGLRQKKLSLGEETLEFFEYEMPDRLNDADRDYLEQLKKSKAREKREDDDEFFEKHGTELARNKALRAKWERFIFGKPIECTDFLVGLLSALERLHGQATTLAGPRTLDIRSAKRTKAQLLDLNADVATAFSLRYRGLPDLLGSKVHWDTPHLFAYEQLIEKAKTRKKYRRNESTSRASLQIKFEIVLKVAPGASVDTTTVQLIWQGQPNAIGIELPCDLERLERMPFLASTVARQVVSRKGSLQAISLGDVTTLEPAFAKDSGSLIPKVNRSADVEKALLSAVKTAVAAARLSSDGGEVILAAWQTFATAYRTAITAWRQTGICSEAMFEQAHAYGELLKMLALHAHGDRNRQSLWQPVASIGAVNVTGGAPALIIAPWHPLRMVAIAVKARTVAGLFAHVLSAEEVNFGDPHLFFADLRSELSHPWYPEVAVGYAGVEPLLLSETSTLNDYSLMERPVVNPSEIVTDVDPREAAREIRSLVERYLQLQPHECSNLSIMLYNCDAAGLPFETVNALASINDGEEVHCNVLVRHRDRGKLGDVYGELLEKAEGDPDALVASETSMNFMSKLRIGVMMTSGSGRATKQREVDVAFLHDVVSRQAKEAWIAIAADDEAIQFAEHVPARWSYRQVSNDAELKATNFLVCPRQPSAGWAYLDLVAGLVERKIVPPGVHHLPARQISFQDQNLKAMFEEVHDLAEWVATYDDLLDRQQLKAQGINVIRYRRQRTHGRNMIVSSMSDLNILRVLVKKRLNELSLGLAGDRIAALSEKMINDALLISGDIVLRAAKRGVSAGELIGLVLSQALVAEELGSDNAVAWFLLDDYANWLGQKEQGIADILALSVSKSADGLFKLRVVVTEAKYVGAEAVADARKTSQQQLRQTIVRIEDALFGDPGRLDRDLWLSRIADLLLDSSVPVGRASMLEAVRDGIRQGKVPIELRGYSHIFVSNPADGGGVNADQDAIIDIKNGLQEVFGRQELRSLVKAYEQNVPLTGIRESLGQERPWKKDDFRQPAPRVSWTVKPSGTAAPIGGELAADIAVKSVPATQLSPPRSEPRGSVAAAPETNSPKSVSAMPEEPEAAPVADPAAANFPALVTAKASQNTSASDVDETWLKTTEQKLRSALMGYGLQAKVLESRMTPNAALIRFSGSDRLGIESIEAKKSGLLTTHGLKLVSVLPLPGEIIVAVERPKRQMVSLWDVWARRQLNTNAVGLNTSFVLGLKELDGEILYLNLGSGFGGEPQHDPHTLIAGATGSGKSVLIQALILDIAATNPSKLAQIILIDPKMGVDYSAIERLPHIQGGIIIEQDGAAEVLDGLVAEMDRRYELFRKVTARDLKTFNGKVPANERLPMIYLVHDEFAEWMLTETYKDAVASTVQRLGVKARAAGIHLIFAAQRPDANVMPVQLRDNLGNRLILKVASIGTSEIALGIKGAESLLGLGHLAARLSGQIHFAQAPFLSDDDLELAVTAICEGDASSSQG